MRSAGRRRIRRGIALAFIVLCLVVPGAVAAGPEGSVLDKFLSGSTVIVPAGETVPHDLYVAGSTVHIDGRIDGDLFVAGGTVDISGPVAGDLFVAGGNVTITSSVGRHLRLAGGNVTVGGPVSLDLLALAGTLTLNPTARVGGDLVFAGGQTLLDGAVDGSVLGSAQTYSRAGSVGGSEQVTLRREKPRPAPAQSLLSLLVEQLQRYLGIILIGVLLLLLAPGFLQGAAARLRERPLASLGAGVLGFIGFFAAVVALLIGMVVLAIPLGLLGLGRVVLALALGVLLGTGVLSYLFMLILLFVAAAVVGLTLGRLGLGGRDEPWAQGPYVALLLGVFVIVVLTAIPILGGLLNAVLILFGLGAIATRLLELRSPAPTPGQI